MEIDEGDSGVAPALVCIASPVATPQRGAPTISVKAIAKFRVLANSTANHCEGPPAAIPFDQVEVQKAAGMDRRQSRLSAKADLAQGGLLYRI